MKEYSFCIPMPAFSINKSTYTDKRHKTQEFRIWEGQFNIWLNEHKLHLSYLTGPVYAVEMFFEYPYEVFYNKAGAINSKTFDLSNVEKPILDLIFRAMEKNDKTVVELSSMKYPGIKHSMFFKIQSRPGVRFPPDLTPSIQAK